MNFKLSKNEFYKYLQIVAKAVSPNSPVPSLCGIHMNVESDAITLTGSDADISIQIKLSNAMNEKLNLNVIETGSIVIDSRYLLDIVRKLDSDEVQIEIIDGTLTRFFGGKAEFKINGYRPTDYPSIDFSVPDTHFVMNANDFSKMIENTVFATSTKETRPVLTGVNLVSDGTRLVATATDSYRLAKKEYPIQCEEFNITVPSKSLNEIRSIFNNNEDLTVAISTKKLQVFNEYILIQSRLLEGGYPETERLIPKDFEHVLVINRSDFIRAIDRSSFIKTDNMTIIRLQINDLNDITLTNKSQEIGESNEELTGLSYDGTPLDISFTGNYVMDAAKALNSENIKISFTTEMKPLILQNEGEDEGILQLVLPVRTYN